MHLFYYSTLVLCFEQIGNNSQINVMQKLLVGGNSETFTVVKSISPNSCVMIYYILLQNNGKRAF